MSSLFRSTDTATELGAIMTTELINAHICTHAHAHTHTQHGCVHVHTHIHTHTYTLLEYTLVTALEHR